MKNKNSEILLKDVCFQSIVKNSIRKKEEEYNILKKKWNTLDSDKILTFPPSETRLKLALEYSEDKAYITILKRDISSLKFKLNISLGKIPKKTKWQMMFNYATQEVRIEDVITHFHGITNFRKNITCPFHQDRSPSMKVYTKTNSFYCFSCHVRGSPIDFVKEKLNCSFKEAVQFINAIKG